MLRVLTLNIWNLDGPWRQRRVAIVEWLRRLQPDLVCLQEIVEGADGQNQARWFAEEVGGYHVGYAGRDIGSGIIIGNAVLTRWPVDAVGDTDLASTPDADGEVPRLVTHVRTRGLDVYSTHLNYRLDDGAIRETQVQELARFVETTADPASALPPIIGGDFNAEPDSTEVRFLAGLTSLDGRSVYYQDAWRVAGGGGPGHTWDNRNPFAAAEHEPNRRIDYVFVGWRRPDGAGQVISAEVTCNEPVDEVHPTDHFGLLAEIAE